MTPRMFNDGEGIHRRKLSRSCGSFYVDFEEATVRMILRLHKKRPTINPYRSPREQRPLRSMRRDLLYESLLDRSTARDQFFQRELATTRGPKKCSPPWSLMAIAAGLAAFSVRGLIPVDSRGFGQARTSDP
mmetsp:Transcript_15940/g.33718  ORF Transcript_15940/g.33718 Transcript_15940/m.33718 type:complete len:132 (+) Transcript_15940:441-836(+)